MREIAFDMSGDYKTILIDASRCLKDDLELFSIIVNVLGKYFWVAIRPALRMRALI